MDTSSLYEKFFGNNSNKFNSLQENMDSISFANPTLSNITPKNITFSSDKTSIQIIKEKLKSIKIAYPNNDEIPLIKINDEYFLESGEIIENYINNLVKFDDSKFNKCTMCNRRGNNYFCKNCYKNICDICFKNCLSNNHVLIDLIEELNKITEYITNIRLIFAECFILPKKRKNNGEIIKKTQNFDFSDDYEMNNEIEEKVMDYTYDIILIEAIIENNYINYFHYKNIEECYNYTIRKYSINLNNETTSILNYSESNKNIIDIEEDYKDYIIIRYKIKNDQKKIKIFGTAFSKKYKNICKIMCGDKIFKLTEYFDVKNSKDNESLEIKLKGINIIEDTNYMFEHCSSLISLDDISKLITNNIKSMIGMFYNCSSLISLPDISNWYTNNVHHMNEMFEHCSSLISLPDISKWNTNNVTNMKEMFYNCSSLISLPDISNWNTSNVAKISGFFYNCLSLISLPDISKWNTNNITNMNRMFYNCSSLISLPDISKWNINNITDISGMFYNCSSLISIPDISKWNISNAIHINAMFYNCSKLISMPNLTKWKKNKFIEMNTIFYNSSSLTTLHN